MVAIGPCLLHEITNCSVCTGLDKKNEAQERQVEAGSWVTIASHPGKCPKCEEFFDVGTTIRRTESGWVCCV